ncbi:MAG: putative rane protein [Herbinix sp.]|jgi:ABC-2 type transport system permease protein|nr:putative rane protein [Herbinix sp.]
MISKPLLKATTKQNYIVFLVILAVLMFYLPIIIGMYDPESQESFNEMLKMLPAQLIAAMGFSGAGSTLLSFIATYFYGFLILLLPMIYAVIVSNRSVASHVDKGSMAYLLSTPNTRSKIARTQALYLLVSITLLIGFITLIGIVMCQIMFPGILDVKGFLLLNVGALLLYYSLTGIGFFASCFFNDTKNSLAIGAGLPVAFLIFQMISDTGDATDFLKYFSLFTLFDPTKIISGEGYVPAFIALAVIAVVMYTAGTYAFHKRDLPL